MKGQNRARIYRCSSLKRLNASIAGLFQQPGSHATPLLLSAVSDSLLTPTRIVPARYERFNAQIHFQTPQMRARSGSTMNMPRRGSR